MEKQRVPEAKTEETSGLLARLGGIKVRGYYWPVRTIVQLGFFVLFSGIGIMSLVPAFNGTRSWVVLPIVSSVKSQAQVTSTMDAITLFLENGLFPWLPIGIMLVVGAILGRFMCGWICPVGFLQDVITSVKGRVDSVEKRAHLYWIRPHFCPNVAQCCRLGRVRLRGLEDSSILVSLRMSSRRNHGRDPKEQPPRNASRPDQMLRMQRVRDRLSDANTNP